MTYGVMCVILSNSKATPRQLKFSYFISDGGYKQNHGLKAAIMLFQMVLAD